MGDTRPSVFRVIDDDSIIDENISNSARTKGMFGSTPVFYGAAELTSRRKKGKHSSRGRPATGVSLPKSMENTAAEPAQRRVTYKDEEKTNIPQGFGAYATKMPNRASRKNRSISEAPGLKSNEKELELNGEEGKTCYLPAPEKPLNKSPKEASQSSPTRHPGSGDMPKFSPLPESEPDEYASPDDEAEQTRSPVVEYHASPAGIGIVYSQGEAGVQPEVMSEDKESSHASLPPENANQIYAECAAPAVMPEGKSASETNSSSCEAPADCVGNSDTTIKVNSIRDAIRLTTSDKRTDDAHVKRVEWDGDLVKHATATRTVCRRDLFRRSGIIPVEDSIAISVPPPCYANDFKRPYLRTDFVTPDNAQVRLSEMSRNRNVSDDTLHPTASAIEKPIALLPGDLLTRGTI